MEVLEMLTVTSSMLPANSTVVMIPTQSQTSRRIEGCKAFTSKVVLPILFITGTVLSLKGAIEAETDCLHNKVDQCKKDKFNLYLGIGFIGCSVLKEVVIGVSTCWTKCFKKETPSSDYQLMQT